MKWIVIGENKGKVALVSKKGVDGMLPKGSFLTVEQDGLKFILRVDSSSQEDIYAPHPLVVDMDLTPLTQDRYSKNLIYAYRVFDIGDRSDGLIDYIKPLSKARRSSQEEVNLALDNLKKGPRVFIATVQYDKNQLLFDDSGKYITATLPHDMFFHQMLISGKTGSGKTVAMKYLSQYFVEEFNGAVLAINVKDVDLLKMDKKSKAQDTSIEKEWKVLNTKPHGVDNFIIYYPANVEISPTKGVNKNIAKKITLDVKTINPESLSGLLQNISDIGAMNLPDIFRNWQENMMNQNNKDIFKFSEFLNYFRLGQENKYTYSTMNTRGEKSEVILHKGTYDNVLRNLNTSAVFFDDPRGEVIDETDILQRGKFTVIDVAAENGIQFGSVLLRQLLSNIVSAKSEQRSKIPVLIVID